MLTGIGSPSLNGTIDRKGKHMTVTRQNREIEPYGRNEAYFISDIMSPGDAGILTSRIETRLNTIPGFKELPMKMQIGLAAACIEMFAKGAIFGHVPTAQQRECIKDV
jgi:hypothetical protein